MVVRILAGNLDGSPPRQHLLVCLVNLLARLHGSVGAIQLDVEGTVSVQLPNIAGSGPAFDAMVAIANWANGGRISVCKPQGQADVVVDIGGDPDAVADLYAWGAGWKSWVGHSPSMFVRDDERLECIGPYFCASVVVGEIFKTSKGLLKGRFVDDDGYSLWTGEQGRWSELPDGPRLDGISLPGCYLVGAGAVGQGVAQILGASSLSSAYLVTIDHDLHDKEGTTSIAASSPASTIFWARRPASSVGTGVTPDWAGTNSREA